MAHSEGSSTVMPESTVEGLEDRRLDLLGLWSRRLFLTFLVLALGLGLLGWLGVRSATSSAQEDGWSLRFDYASVARAGLDVPWRVTVRHDGGLGKTVTLSLTGDALGIYETQAFHPEPSAEWRDGSRLYLQFDAPPDSDTMVVTYDAYIQPSAQQGRGGTLAVVQDGLPVASVTFQTRLLP
jgi:hypothetical protein